MLGSCPYAKENIMPASYLHQSVALEALAQFGEEPVKDFNEAAYTAGSEGPDPLFFTLVSPKGVVKPPEVGHLIHKQKTGEFLIRLARLAKGDEVAMSYVLGFFTHYATDTVFHPFIYSRSFMPDGHVDGNMHCKYEHVLDVYVYRKQGNLSGLPVQMKGFRNLTGYGRKDVAELLYQAVRDVFPEKILTLKQVRNSFKHAMFLCGLLAREGVKKRSLILDFFKKTPVWPAGDAHLMPDDTLENLTQPGPYSASIYSWPNVTNEERLPWHSYWEPDIARDDTVDELLDKARDRARLFLAAGRDYFMGDISESELTGILGSMSYDSGLPWEKTGKIE